MKLQKIRSAFTLIELLVVITIIGILATGAVNVYTSQIQKARDSTRITDLNALRTGLEQSYQDNWTYPNSWAAVWTDAKEFISIKTYVPKLPKDPKTNQKATNTNFDYSYAVAADTNWIAFQIYEVSTSFEQSWNTTEKASKDNWNDDNRLELGISIDTLKTQLNRASLWTSWIGSATPTYICESVTWTPPAATSSTTCNSTIPSTNVNTSALVIR